MAKKPKVNYPKRRLKLDIDSMTFGIPEPERQNMYDLVLANFRASNRVSSHTVFANQIIITSLVVASFHTNIRSFSSSLLSLPTDYFPHG